MTTLTIKQWPVAIQSGKETLLASALKAGAPFPNQCRTGECGSCRCKLLNGRVRQDSCLPEALSSEQQAKGWILACRSRALEDVELDCPGNWASIAPHPVRTEATVVDVNTVAERIVHLRLRRRGGSFNFIAGQYFDLAFKGLPTRSYSPANAPGSPILDFYISVHDAGRVSGYIARSAENGDSVRLDGPYGDAYLQPDTPAPILGVAIGTGLAPLLSIAHSYADNMETERTMQLLLQARAPDAAFANDALQAISRQNAGFRYRQLYRADTISNHDPLNQELLQVLQGASDYKDWQVHVAGPPAAVTSVRGLLLRQGVDSNNIHIDAFTTNNSHGGVIGSGLFRQLSGSVAQLFGKSPP